MFLIIPLRADKPMGRYPIANWAIIGMTAVTFFATRGDQAVVRQYALIPAGVTMAGLVSHVFLHGDVVHLVGNMLFLFVFGNNVNARMGHFKYTVCYLALGALAGLTHCAVDPRSGIPMIGASGAICGVTAMFVLWYPRYHVQMGWFIWVIIIVRYGTFWITSAWAVLVWFVLDLLGALMLGGNGVAYFAHLGGYGAGIAAAYLLVQLRLIERNGEELFSFRAAR